jgi:hypothetical protein
MNAYREKAELQRELERYRDLLREFPKGATNETLIDYIAELEQQLLAADRILRQEGPSAAGSVCPRCPSSRLLESP